MEKASTWPQHYIMVPQRYFSINDAKKQKQI